VKESAPPALERDPSGFDAVGVATRPPLASFRGSFPEKVHSATGSEAPRGRAVESSPVAVAMRRVPRNNMDEKRMVSCGGFTD
jgi:hypothetical protein